MADNCEQVRKELVKATKKVTEWRNDALRQFDQAISAAEELLQSIDEGNFFIIHDPSSNTALGYISCSLVKSLLDRSK